MSASAILKIDATDVPVNLLGAADIERSNPSDVSQDIADILSSFSPQDQTDKARGKEQRQAPHFRVRWKADIATDGQSVLHGFINDISMQGASIYLNRSLLQVKATLHIHIPPLSLTSEPYLMTVSGNIVYVVHDANQQLFRAAINFSRFHVESDKTYLDDRLTRYHLKISELS